LSDDRYLYISHREDLADLCEALADEPVIAVDTEFINEQTFYPRLEIIQVATPVHQGEAIEAIIDYRAIYKNEGHAALEPLWTLLSEPEPELILHDAREDFRILYHVMNRPLRSVFDTQLAMSFLDERLQIGYGNLVSDVLRVKVDKTPQLMDWSQRPLSQGMLHYALEDVRHLIALREWQLEELADCGRLDWFREDQAEALREPEASDPDEAWRRVKKGGHLQPDQMAVLREIATWREQIARDEDVPLSRVMQDETIVILARMKPRSPLELRQALQRKSGAGLSDRHHPGLLAAIQRGMKNPRPPAIPDGNGGASAATKQLVSLMGAFVEAQARDLGMASARLVRTADLSDLVDYAAGDVGTRGGRALQGWRKSVIGDELLAIAQGRRSLHWDPKRRGLVSSDRD